MSSGFIRKAQSGIGHHRVLPEQLRFFHHQCWILPIRKYQLVGDEGDVETVRADDTDVDCVSFRTTMLTMGCLHDACTADAEKDL